MPKEISSEELEKKGTVYLRDYLMEGVVPEEIAEQDGRWCAIKHQLLTGAVLIGSLHPETLENDNPYSMGLYSVALEERLRTIGFQGVQALKSIPNLKEQLAALNL